MRLGARVQVQVFEAACRRGPGQQSMTTREPPFAEELIRRRSYLSRGGTWIERARRSGFIYAATPALMSIAGCCTAWLSVDAAIDAPAELTY